MFILSIGFFVASLAAQPAGDPASDLEFWVGSWTMDLRLPGDKATKGEWQLGACTNTVSREFAGKVVREDCKGSGLFGGSWSVYNARKKTWQQTWVDDQGNYMLFEGGKSGDEFVLNQVNSAKGHHARMRFTDISGDGFDWLWEKSADGKKWDLSMGLRYHRRQ